MIKLGIIGCGNMGGAILRQILKAGILKNNEVIASDMNQELREKLQKELGIITTADNAAAAKAPCVLLAIKPQFIRAVGADIKSAINPDTLILSIVAGYTLQMLHDLLESPGASIVRVMPNTPAMVGEGVLAACRGQHVKEEQWQFSKSLLQWPSEKLPRRRHRYFWSLSSRSR